MQFLLDSCISSFAVKDLKEAAHDVIWVAELKSDPGDEAILKKAFDEKRILVTADKDFGELVFVFSKPHPSIVRLVEIPAKSQGRVLLQLIKTHRGDLERQALITVERYRIRIRLPESSG